MKEQYGVAHHSMRQNQILPHPNPHPNLQDTPHTCVSMAVVSILLSMPRVGFSLSRQNSSISSNRIIVLIQRNREEKG
jgi:hypothetical protein